MEEVEDAVQDEASAPLPGDSDHLGMGSPPASSVPQGAVRRAQEAHPGAPQPFSVSGNLEWLLLVGAEAKRCWFKSEIPHALSSLSAGFTLFIASQIFSTPFSVAHSGMGKIHRPLLRRKPPAAGSSIETSSRVMA